ncbi:MAG: hypothetical protein UU73_C0003G0258 [Candidatus Daviesbacteria bacterium GW2011_GWA1_41_61]|uniref:Uncharacterized protein n=1 Tax=Candidatus Daviesbacteria bacterium GW2011_GWA2_40_9 TaxID=1618424 RepID=A0A0G0U3W0_9BACT|nr:MAG: hypothetical protein UU26_C0004G0024 [Candidatus Daviesbacteria bacterium GW2011_GWC1_40_9]KKR83783.1 MAG: hypothetical protein UU29_C0001G0003 [Candidatus Daviesbacteria bacterium GW2011_GWA2_40_9]KKR93392.1 MAG: hypothetical protein UU44_C0002G0053 [Candidatus Daviesbacteria bacterium GW2011_GWB1_41_15]KKS15059.1 MAG: hypothetical protein UU73_C0003G0258 [Candidatus Daviesbacteria bacterium GW2011_GWA1_41_61]
MSKKNTTEDGFKKYGFAGEKEVESGIIRVNKIIEKPGSREASPSDLASISGFVITPDIYQHLEEAKQNLQRLT